VKKKKRERERERKKDRERGGENDTCASTPDGEELATVGATYNIGDVESEIAHRRRLYI